VSRKRVTLEELLGRQVLDPDGKRAGHIHAARAEIVGGKCVVREWHLGRRAFLERLGLGTLGLFHLRGRAPRVVPWDRLYLSDPAHPRLCCRIDELDP
jgi:hypothetical protein